MASFEEESSHCVYDVIIHASKGACAVPAPTPSPDSSGMSGVAIFFIVVIVVVIASVGSLLAYQTYFKGEPASALLDCEFLAGCSNPCASRPAYQFERLATEDPDDL